MSFETGERDGRRLKLSLVRTARGVWVGWPGGAKFFGPEGTEAAAGGAAPAEVRAPMTGRVVQVPVRAGQSVEAGGVLVILQAMKMEYRLTAPRAGVVETVACAEGEMVELGATLVTLASVPEPAGASGPSEATPTSRTKERSMRHRRSARRGRP